ncbi:unnamed protein product [Durusdinium trenchii]|uniref:Uncharacterized protein n=1 Tax=Durusdinium trenchii TaxID=1381693 RepID=A0ABP0JQE7_9DINO
MAWILAIVLLGVAADGAATFTTRTELKAAVNDWSAANETERQHLRIRWGDISTWNVSLVTNFSGLFQGLDGFNEAVGAWETSAVLDMSHAFHGAKSFNQPLMWNTSNVRYMHYMFANASAFNQAVGSWDTSNVQNVKGMFAGASAFNQALGEWNTSAVTTMAGMFARAASFNQSLDKWNTSCVVDMSYTFRHAVVFNQAVGSWDTSQVTTVRSMFYGAGSFNQSLDKWNTPSVVDMSFAFYDAVAFNQAVGSWDTSQVITMRSMFSLARSFNHALEDWNVSSVVTMRGMFEDADNFNHPLGTWHTSAVADMSIMFARTDRFNQPLNGWDTSSVKNMSCMFIHATGFDQPLGRWNVSAVVDMSQMFSGATAFDQPLGTWDFASVNASMMEGMLTANHMSRCNLRSLSQARRLPGRLKRYWGFSTCSSCEARRCPDSKQACVDGECHPVNSNFIEVGQGQWGQNQWTPQQLQKVDLVDVAPTYRGCAEVCEGFVNCSAFVLEKGRCALYIGKGLPEKRGEGTARAFLKPRCEFFTCPAEGVLTGVEGPAVTAASCCRCRDATRVKDLSAAPANLHCISCPAGWEPMTWSSCRPCQPGFIARGSKCVRCGEGLEPNAAQSDCRDCPPGHFATADMDACKPCEFPRMLFGDKCAPWPLVVILLFLLVCAGVMFFVSRAVLKAGRKRTLARVQQAQKLVQMLDSDLWQAEETTTVETYAAQLQELGWTRGEVVQKAGEIRAQHSRIAGVSMRYLLSDFTDLAEQRAQKPNPDFHELKVAFWFGADPLGEQVPCPRDGEPGCALVDLLPKADRKPQTHFMSWTWRYTLKQIQSALAIWSSSTRIEAERVFFFMCFFVNNQFRIMKDQSVRSGSDDLDHVFESNLRRIGQVVAILDAWHEPIYLQRVWTVYEQYVACSLEVPVTFVMPAEAQWSLTAEINRGEPGINEVTASLCQVDSANAEAFDPRDEFKVKKVIQETVGFEEVNEHVRQALVQWISGVVRLQFQELLKRQARPKRAEPEPEPAEPVAGSAPALAGGGHEVGRQIIPI